MALACNFSDQYPFEESVDDDNNELALNLLHQTWVVVQEINEAIESGPLDDEQVEKLGRRIERPLHDKYVTVISDAESRTSRRDRKLGNADWAVANLYALCIFLLRCSGHPETDSPSRPLPPDVDSIARDPSRLVQLMRRSLAGCASGQIDRLQWPLFWAGAETRDNEDREWIFEGLVSTALSATLAVVVDEQDRNGVWTGINRIREICRVCLAANTPIFLS